MLLLQVTYALTLSPMAWGYAAEAWFVETQTEHCRHQYLAVQLRLRPVRASGSPKCHMKDLSVLCFGSDVLHLYLCCTFITWSLISHP
jgi:hypothetical protein